MAYNEEDRTNASMRHTRARTDSEEFRNLIYSGFVPTAEEMKKYAKGGKERDNSMFFATPKRRAFNRMRAIEDIESKVSDLFFRISEELTRGEGNLPGYKQQVEKIKKRAISYGLNELAESVATKYQNLINAIKPKKEWEINQHL